MRNRNFGLSIDRSEHLQISQRRTTIDQPREHEEDDEKDRTKLK